MDLARGVDVSHHNPVVDWGSLVAAGFSFLGMKASQGAAWRDQTLAAHRDGRRSRPELAAAILYHFPSGLDPAAEAANFLGAVGELRDDEFLCLDVEQGPSGKGAPPIEWQRAFVAALPLRRIPPLIYTAAHVWDEIGAPPWPEAASGQVGLWIKRYRPVTMGPGPMPAPWPSWLFWQQSESASVPGVLNPADLDLFNGSADDLRRYVAGA